METPPALSARILVQATRRELEAQGHTIGMADYLIAGICLSRSAALVTRNRKHFERLPALGLADL